MRAAIRIKVEDCRNCDYHDTKDCPVARAMLRVLKDGYKLMVGGDNMSIWKDSILNSVEGTFKLDKFNCDIMANTKEDIILTVTVPEHVIDWNKLLNQWVDNDGNEKPMKKSWWQKWKQTILGWFWKDA